MALLETPDLLKLNKIPCAFQQSCPCLCTSFCPNSHGVECWGTLGTQVLKPLSHHEVPHLRSGSVGSTHRAGTSAMWLEGVFQAPQYYMVGLRLWSSISSWGLEVWCSWPPSSQCCGEPLWAESSSLRTSALCFGERGFRDLGAQEF